MHKSSALAALAAFGLFIGSPALAAGQGQVVAHGQVVHVGHSVLTAIICNLNNIPNDGSFSRFVSTHGAFLSFGKPFDSSSCVIPGGRIDAFPNPANNWVITLTTGSTLDGLSVQTEIIHADGSTDFGYEYNARPTRTGWVLTPGSDSVGSLRGDRYGTIYIFTDNFEGVSYLLDVAHSGVDGVVLTPNLHAGTQQDCNFEDKTEIQCQVGN